MKKTQYAFTLIEIMIVVVILGILAAVIVPKVMSRPEEARRVKAEQDIMAIEEALDLYKLDNGFYPNTDQGLSALVNEPSSDPKPQHWRAEGYLKNLPLDPWGHEYQYLSPGQHGEIDIFTFSPGSGNTNSDQNNINNWSRK